MAVADFTEADLRQVLREEMDRSRLAVLVRQLQEGAQPAAVFPQLPRDGQRMLYQADPVRQVLWELRYNAAGALKWEFVGGGDLFAYAGGGVSVTAGALTYQAGGPSITVPTAAKVKVRFGGDINLSTAGMWGRIGLHLGGVLVDTCEATTDATGGAWNGWMSVSKEVEVTAGGGVALDLRYLRSTANVMQVAKAFVSVTPVAVA